jgi:hypothetical protein
MTRTSRILAVALTELAFCFVAHGSQNVTLEWNASADRATAGYVVRYGTNSGSYLSQINVATNTVVTLSGLADGQTYYFVVGGYNSAGLDGPLSSQVSFVAPTSAPQTNAPPPTNTPPGHRRGKANVAVAPASGVPGSKVYVYATNLSDTTSVSFNGAPASFGLISNSCLVVIVPAGATTGPLNITTSSDAVTGQFAVTATTAPPANDIFASAQSHLLAPIALGDGSQMVNFNVVSGHSYRVLASTNMTSWSQVGSFYANGTSASYIDAEAGSCPQRFYRLVSP